jgi:hypothetical protein
MLLKKKPVDEKKNEISLDEKEEEVHDLKYFFRRYIQEIFEASIGLFIVMLITKRDFTLKEAVRIALILGFVTLLLEEYNMEYADNVKQGMYFTMGAITFG